MKPSGKSDDFIRMAVTKVVEALREKVRKSNLPENSTDFQPIYQHTNWRRNLKTKTKALKKASLYKEKERKSLKMRA